MKLGPKKALSAIADEIQVAIRRLLAFSCSKDWFSSVTPVAASEMLWRRALSLW
jgi:hypothetical protein